MLEQYEPPSAVLSKVNQMLNRKPNNPIVTALFGYLDVQEVRLNMRPRQMPPLWVRGTGTPNTYPRTAFRCALSRN